MNTDIWATLHLPSPGTESHNSICRKMPYASFDRLADTLFMDGEALGRCLGISPKTLLNGVKTGHFSSRESERLYALIAVLQASCQLFEGDVQTASRFLISPLRGLNSKTPLEILRKGGGEARAVIDLIGRLENGILL
ncbi:antitoxin Xre/MbcA/ParS toxin-binding domain-containing protein [Pseudomonas fluorescens]|nr:antitoxin Xre/MbcA/ParS toxin-binding domain-containing protein [Pseudomonas fluorescens]